MIRENYTSLGGWTLEEFKHYWDGERRMEAVIKAGSFGTAIKGGLDAAEKEVRIKQGESILKKIKRFLWH